MSTHRVYEVVVFVLIRYLQTAHLSVQIVNEFFMAYSGWSFGYELVAFVTKIYQSNRVRDFLLDAECTQPAHHVYNGCSGFGYKLPAFVTRSYQSNCMISFFIDEA